MEFSGERADWGWSQIEIRERDCSPCGSTETRVSFNDADVSLAASRDGFSSDGRDLGGRGRAILRGITSIFLFLIDPNITS
jgi:hypothetical protein